MASASDAVRRRCSRPGGRKDKAVIEAPPRRDGVSDFEGMSLVALELTALDTDGADRERDEWAPMMASTQEL